MHLFIKSNYFIIKELLQALVLIKPVESYSHLIEKNKNDSLIFNSIDKLNWEEIKEKKNLKVIILDTIFVD